MLRKKGRVEAEIERLRKDRLDKALRRPGVTYAEVASGMAGAISGEEAKEVEIEIKYEGFINRQLGEISRMDKIERVRMPADMDYKAVSGLSSEIKEKLSRIRPLNLGQAARISGVTPAAVSILMIYMKKRRKGDDGNKTL